MTLKWTRTPNFHPNSPLSRSNSAVHVAISTWPKSNRALAGRATGSGGSATRAPPPSITKIREIRRASNTLSSPSLDHETRGNRWTEGVHTVKMECGGNCRRVLGKTRGQTGSRTCRSEILIHPDEEFFRLSACSTRVSRKLKFLFRLQIFVVSVGSEWVDREDRWWRMIRVSRQDILRVDFLEFLLEFFAESTRFRFRIIDNWDWSYKFLRLCYWICYARILMKVACVFGLMLYMDFFRWKIFLKLQVLFFEYYKYWKEIWNLNILLLHIYDKRKYKVSLKIDDSRRI